MQQLYSRILPNACEVLQLLRYCPPPSSPYSLADDLLDELVQDVSSELGQLCDSCVEQLYSHEFARPSDE